MYKASKRFAHLVLLLLAFAIVSYAKPKRDGRGSFDIDGTDRATSTVTSTSTSNNDLVSVTSSIKINGGGKGKSKLKAKRIRGFAADSVSAGIDTEPGDAGTGAETQNVAITVQEPGIELVRNTANPVGSLEFECGCSGEVSVHTDDIRALSDTWMSDGTSMSSHGLSNMFWSFGQFIDRTFSHATCILSCNQVSSID
jgi:hypothetical protein